MTAAARLSPFQPPRPARRRLAILLLASVLLHALALLALWTWPQPRDDGEAGATPSFEVLFAPPGAPVQGPDSQGGQPPAPAPPTPDSLPGPPSPAPEAPPDLAAPPSPPAVTAPELPPEATAPPPPVPEALPPPPQPATATATVPDAAPPPVPAPAPPVPAPPLPTAPAEPLPEPAAPEAPSVRLQEPPPPPVASLPTVPDVVIPVAPPPLPARPLPALARPSVPAPRPRTAPPAAPPGTFGNPMDLSFAPGPSRFAAPRLGARAGTVASRSLDLSTGAGKAPNRQEAFFDARAARIGEGWKDGLMGYWLRHRYYPRQALEAGEDGQVEIELTVNRQGRVESVNVIGKSGSPWLDMAAQATWRGAQLNPLPLEVAGDSITFSITISYILMR